MIDKLYLYLNFNLFTSLLGVTFTSTDTLPFIVIPELQSVK